MKEELEIGDIVRLKSGGPKMRVQADFPHTPDVICEWYDGTETKTEPFRPQSLEKIDDES